MNNRQLIKVGHAWALVVLLVSALCALGGSAVIGHQNQNSNQNSNSNANSNTHRSQNRNANKAENANTGASGERTGMSSMTKDHEFLMEAAMGGLMEVELGHIAVQKGVSDAVKQFGQRMVDDHSKANEALMTLAQSKGMTLPTALDEKHQKDVTKLSALTGAEFDRAYSKLMLSDHKKDVAEFEKQSTKAADPDVKAFASQTLPTLQQHLEMAKALNPSSGNSNSNNGGGSKNSNRNSNSNSNSNRP
jgi:putative membrane protein